MYKHLSQQKTLKLSSIRYVQEKLCRILILSFGGIIINIVYATDKNYWMHLYVSLYSLLINNRDNEVRVFVLTDHVDKTFNLYLPNLFKLGNLYELKYINTDRAAFQSIEIQDPFTPAIFDRLLIGSLIPKEVEKLLYLDCDTVIDNSINKLLDINVEQYVLAAVEDWDSNRSAKRIGLPEGFKYFNSGMLLINLNNWRNREIETKLFKYIKENSKTLIYPDQDVLNGVLYNHWLEIDPTYNYLEYKDEVMHPYVKHSIIHYIGSPKPWLYKSRYPHKARYWHYLRETPYQGYREPDRTLINCLIKHRDIIVGYGRKLINKVTIIKLILKFFISKFKRH